MKPVTVTVDEAYPYGVHIKRGIGSCNYISGGWFKRFRVAAEKLQPGDKLTFTLEVTPAKRRKKK